MNDPYTTLGVPSGTSAEDCKAAFHKLAKVCHPDLHSNDPPELRLQAETQFKEISAAYDAIINPQPAQPQPQAQQWNFHDIRFNFDPGNIGGSPFDHLFAQMHGQQRQDLTFEVRLSLEEIYQGKQLTIQVPEQRPGSGAREIKVQVPPGVEDGMRLVVPQAGHQSHPTARPGDLYILIRINPHPRFGRAGLHLTTLVPVTVFDVLLGNEIEVVSITGQTIRVAIPSNFDSTRKLRLAGQGLIDGRGIHGDLLIDLFIQYPIVPEQHRDALRQIAAAINSKI
jgi:curved DNA-binding protein